nr:hypothetical protein [Mycolicibacterium austroafricanum]
MSATSGHTSARQFAEYDPDTHSWRTWPAIGLWGSIEYLETWPRLAAAAVDALQLTEEIGYALPGEVTEYGQPDAWFSACDIRDAPDIAEKLNDGRQLFRRLVGPWVVQPEAASDE